MVIYKSEIERAKDLLERAGYIVLKRSDVHTADVKLTLDDMLAYDFHGADFVAAHRDVAIRSLALLVRERPELIGHAEGRQENAVEHTFSINVIDPKAITA